MIQVRLAQESDLPGLAAIRYADHPAIHLDRIGASDGQTLQYFVAEDSHSVIGFGLLILERPPDWSNSNSYFPIMIDIFVAELYRSRGIGRALITSMEDFARHHGKKEIYLSVEPEANPRAMALYARLGYVPLQTESYHDVWQFTDSEGVLHQGEQWLIDMRKQLL